MRKIHGVGINDANYELVRHEYKEGRRRQVWMCPFYARWRAMLGRCYSKQFLEKHPTYRDCLVCEEWLTFSNFKAWMEDQEWENMDLDKDFKMGGNKIYSADTCIFLPQEINKLITRNKEPNAKYPLGVKFNPNSKINPYSARCSDGGSKAIHLGCFPTVQEAHRAYLQKKFEICEDYILKYKDNPNIQMGLIRVRDKILTHLYNNTELTNFNT